jgi:hypothetical protein
MACHLLADFVAKVGEGRFVSKMRNNRIGAIEFLNQHFALAANLESMILARMRKIFLQQNRHRFAGSRASSNVPLCHARAASR